jgi:hypothetical protein
MQIGIFQQRCGDIGVVQGRRLGETMTPLLRCEMSLADSHQSI